MKVGVNGMVNIAEEYMGFVDEVNDAKLLALASERMAMADSSQFVPAERLYEELGITQDDLDTVGDVDIEWIEGRKNVWLRRAGRLFLLGALHYWP